jgi:DNA polymerase III psi subunit
MSVFEISPDKNLFRHIFNEDLYLIGNENKNPSPGEELKSVKRSAEAEIKELALIVLSEDEKQEYKTTLTKIIQALNIQPSGADIFSKEEAGKALDGNYKIYISFGEGIRKTGTGIILNLNKAVREGNSLFLLTDSLATLDKNSDKKRALWGIMQKYIIRG